MKICSLFLLMAFSVWGRPGYYQRVLFDNSLTSDSYFYSSGQASSPSTLSLVQGRLPVDTKHFRTPPNALILRWSSDPKGGWEAEVRAYEFRNRNLFFPGQALTFWCFSENEISGAQLPRLALRDSNRNFSHPVALDKYAGKITGGEWTKIAIPLEAFPSASLREFEPHRTTVLVFVQGEGDGVEHSLTIDDIRIEDPEASSVPLPQVSEVQARGYERHVDISWQVESDSGVDHYVISRRQGTSGFVPVGIQMPGVHRYADFIGAANMEAQYQVSAADADGRLSVPSSVVSAKTHPMTDEELLTMVQEACFRYYWEGAHPASGMIRENVPGEDDVVATGASGFGIMALVVGVERGFITREQGLERVSRIADFLRRADRYHGVWPHFTNGSTGKRIPVFGMVENGADLVETSFLLEGLLTARQYFAGDTAQEKTLNSKITKLWEGVEWDWFRRTPDGDALIWHWSPEYTWQINHRLTGFNETMITYLLAIASPTHGVPASLYYTGWAGQSAKAVAYRQAWGQAAAGDHYTNGQTYEGIKLDVGVGEGGPLFFSHYSYLGFDPHVSDRFTNYFRNNRNQALINLAYCVRNPKHYTGYGRQCWGITAVDGPKGYSAYEPKPSEDDGTIAPTGAVSSMPYTPEPSLEALKFFYRELGDRLWGQWGFRDAFNLQQNWFSGIYMGLNQAPMVIMIENYRTGLIWKNFMANPEIQSMLKQVGFKAGK